MGSSLGALSRSSSADHPKSEIASKRLWRCSFRAPPGSARRFAIEFVELRERVPSLVGPAAVTPFTVEHASGAPAYALRVEYGGKVITYSGDTEWTESLVARGSPGPCQLGLTPRPGVRGVRAGGPASPVEALDL